MNIPKLFKRRKEEPKEKSEDSMFDENGKPRIKEKQIVLATFNEKTQIGFLSHICSQGTEEICYINPIEKQEGDNFWPDHSSKYIVKREDIVGPIYKV